MSSFPSFHGSHVEKGKVWLRVLVSYLSDTRVRIARELSRQFFDTSFKREQELSLLRVDKQEFV